MTQTVEPGLAAWLKSEALYSTATDTAAAAKWSERATATTIISPYAYLSDAQTEAVVQLDFLAGPYVRDEHVVDGLWSSLVGTTVMLTSNRMGYANGASVFVIAAAEAEVANTTTLTVLYALGAASA